MPRLVSNVEDQLVDQVTSITKHTFISKPSHFLEFSLQMGGSVFINQRSENISCESESNVSCKPHKV